MKRCCVVGLGLLLAVPVAVRAEAGFWGQLTPEERRAAGVERLSPEQQQALDALAGRFAREGARQVREAVQAEVRAEVRQEVREETRREVKAAERARDEAQLGLPPSEKQEAIVSRFHGPFNGWSGHTVFALENGQVWVQTNSGDNLWLPTMQNPELEIRPAFGGWKLSVRGTSYWLRVRRLK